MAHVEPRRRPSRLRRAGALILGVLGAASTLSACRTNGLLFTNSSVFRIVTPHQSATVTLPVRISWSTGSPYRTGDRFAVFLDRSTMQPGKNILSLIPKSCKEDSTCSQVNFLNQEDVWVTSSPSFVFDSLPRTSLTGRPTGNEDHSVTVVVLNPSGSRVGEAFASIDFVYQRRGV